MRRPVKPLDASKLYRKGEEPERPSIPSPASLQSALDAFTAFEGVIQAQAHGPEDATLALWMTLMRLEEAWLQVSFDPAAADWGMQLLSACEADIKWIVNRWPEWQKDASGAYEVRKVRALCARLRMASLNPIGSA